jgi:hypothetical protein
LRGAAATLSKPHAVPEDGDFHHAFRTLPARSMGAHRGSRKNPIACVVARGAIV